jgi:exonuclease III
MRSGPPYSAPYWGAVSVLVCLLATGSLVNAATISVAAGGDLQDALNKAIPGDVILLEPGATFVGNFELPNKGETTDFITIRSAAPDADLPGPGIRITPAYAALLPKIRSSNKMAALRTATSANHYKLLFLEFQANYAGFGEIISFGAADSTQTMASQAPHALVIDRVYVHGDPLFGQKRGIGLNSRNTDVINSYVSDCKSIGQDSQAIGGFNGPGNFRIENNYLEGAGENVMFGGSDPTIQSLVTTNITFRHNHVPKPLAWRDPIVATPAVVAARVVAGTLAAGTYSYRVAARLTSNQNARATSASSVEVSATIAAGTTGGVRITWAPVAGSEQYLVYGRNGGDQTMYWKTSDAFYVDAGDAGTAVGSPSAIEKPTYGGTTWVVKNTFELKNAQDVLVEGNVFENLWVAEQNGYPIVFTPRNQGGLAPWTVVQRVVFRHNLVRHTAGGVSILGIDNVNPSQRTNTIAIRDNVFDDLTAATWGSGSRPFILGDGPDHVTIDHNTIFSTNPHLVRLYGGTATAPSAATNSVVTNNMAAHNTYGIMASGIAFGIESINMYLPGVNNVAANVLAGGSAWRYPAGNLFPTDEDWKANFRNLATGDYRLKYDSPYKNAGLDGRDLGADIETLSTHVPIALSGRDDANVLKILPAALTDGVYNQFYSESISCAGNIGPCVFSVSASTLPGGLSFDAIAGLISGVPTSAGTGSITIDAYDSMSQQNTATTTLSITVAPAPSKTGALEIVLYAADATTIAGTWSTVADATAAGGKRIWNEDVAAAKMFVPLATPANYFELTFAADAGVGYHLWLRGKADADYWANDSVFVQFSGSVDAAGAAVNRIGTTGAAVVCIEDGTFAGLAGWGWADDAYGTLAGPMYFTAGPQTIRIQVREDGVSIDQIVLSSDRYVASAPGGTKNDTTILPRSAVTLNASGALNVTPAGRGDFSLTAVSAAAGTAVSAAAGTAVSVAAGTAVSAAAGPTAKLAFFNIQSGKGEQAMPGHAAPFVESLNCTDPTLPLNAWGVGFLQAELQAKLGSDPSVLALGLAEAWFCGNPENVRRALNWAAHSGEQNGLGIVSRHGFARAVTYFKLDTSLSTNPEPRYILHAPVCVDAACSASFDVFVIHAYADGASAVDSLVRQMQQSVAFMAAQAGTRPRVVIGDFNVYEEMGPPCGDSPKPPRILDVLRQAGYVDSWRAIHGDTPGYTGMNNRPGCGSPEGGLYKRIDYAWSLDAPPQSMSRFGMMPPGDATYSDHVGILAEFPIAAVPVPDTTPPQASVTSPVEGGVVSGLVPVVADATDEGGVALVSILADGALLGSVTVAPYSRVWDTTHLPNGMHTLQVQATDRSGNMSLSPLRTVTVNNVVVAPGDGSGGIDEVVIQASAASITGLWQIVSDESAASGRRLYNPDLAAAKATAASAAPASYADLTFYADKGKAYRLWMRGRADADYWANDSAFVQFNDAVDASGAAIWSIGTTNATTISIEAGTNAGLAGWGWASNLYGGLGPLVSFATSGEHTIRLQIREDGMSIDQIVLSAKTYLSTAPGATKNDTTILALPVPPVAGTREVVLYASEAAAFGAWHLVADPTAAGGALMATPNAGAPKLTAALAAPASYLDLTFAADAGIGYRLWLRGKAEQNSWANDSVYVQFSDAVDAAGASVWPIGTALATSVSLEECSNCGVSGWGWQDNGWGSAGTLGPLVQFAQSGSHTIRIQVREDGFSIDQVVLSSERYLTVAPGANRNDTTVLPR